MLLWVTDMTVLGMVETMVLNAEGGIENPLTSWDFNPRPSEC